MAQDPFQNADSMSDEMLASFADSMDVRAADPTMEAIVAAYLSHLTFGAGSLSIEVGAGAGAVSRPIATAAAPGRVIGFEPSEGFIRHARDRAAGIGNLSFAQASGTDLPLEDGTVDNVVMHTVLTHVPDPTLLIAEAHRVLKRGGRLVICDADFSRATLRAFKNDPLEPCAREFVDSFVTDPFLVGKLRPMLDEAGFAVDVFEMTSRVVQTSAMLTWVKMTSDLMVSRGEIAQALADALVAEHDRRAAAETQFGYQVFATVVARKA